MSNINHILPQFNQNRFIDGGHMGRSKQNLYKTVNGAMASVEVGNYLLDDRTDHREPTKYFRSSKLLKFKKGVKLLESR